MWPGAFDAMSARLIERAGFEAVMAGGFAAIGSLLAAPDLGQSNVRDYADHYERICSAVTIPVYVDADTGFGGLHNTYAMVRAFESAGVAGIFFSDQVFPNRCGYLPGKEVVSTEAMLARIAAALDARTDPNLVIVGRTDVYGIEGLDEAIERCRLFVDAGADMTMAQGVDQIEEICRAVREIPGPFMAILSQAAGMARNNFADLEDAGVRAVCLPSALLFAAVQSVTQALETIKSDGSIGTLGDQVIGLEEYYDIVGITDMLEREQRYDDLAHQLVEGATGRQRPVS